MRFFVLFAALSFAAPGCFPGLNALNHLAALPRAQFGLESLGEWSVVPGGLLPGFWWWFLWSFDGFCWVLVGFGLKSSKRSLENHSLGDHKGQAVWVFSRSEKRKRFQALFLAGIQATK